MSDPHHAEVRDSGLAHITGYTVHDTNSRTAWTPARVEEQLRKAAALREAPSSNDTEIASGAKGIGIIGGIGGIGVAAASADGDEVVAKAAEALSWLRWLDPDDTGIVLARLDGAPWKAICWRFGISRPTADRRWRYAIALIAWRLNGARTDRTPSLRSLLRLRRAARPESCKSSRGAGDDQE